MITKCAKRFPNQFLNLLAKEFYNLMYLWTYLKSHMLQLIKQHLYRDFQKLGHSLSVSKIRRQKRNRQRNVRTRTVRHTEKRYNWSPQAPSQAPERNLPPDSPRSTSIHLTVVGVAPRGPCWHVTMNGSKWPGRRDKRIYRCPRFGSPCWYA